MNKHIAVILTGLIIAGSATAQPATQPTQLYWGDTHLHTSQSFDAFLNLNESAALEDFLLASLRRWTKR